MYFDVPFTKIWVSLHFHFYWTAWWHLWPHYETSVWQEDYGMPEYAAQYPWVRGSTFCFGPFQWMWYRDADGPEKS